MIHMSAINSGTGSSLTQQYSLVLPGFNQSTEVHVKLILYLSVAIVTCVRLI